MIEMQPCGDGNQRDEWLRKFEFLNSAHEQSIGFLIECYAGNFPLWLAPDQVRVSTLTTTKR
jgi:hypothetical protein